HRDVDVHAVRVRARQDARRGPPLAGLVARAAIEVPRRAARAVVDADADRAGEIELAAEAFVFTGAIAIEHARGRRRRQACAGAAGVDHLRATGGHRTRVHVLEELARVRVRAERVERGRVRLPEAVLPDPVLPDAVLPDPVFPDPVFPDPVFPDAVLPDP